MSGKLTGLTFGIPSCAPVAVCGGWTIGLIAGVPSETRFVDDGRAEGVRIGEDQIVEVDRRHVDGVHHRPEQFVGKASRCADAVLRVTAEDLVFRVELVIYFAIPTCNVVPAFGWNYQIVG